MSGFKRQWTCDQCGKVASWDDNWRTWGSLAEQDEGGRQLVICSEDCQSACSPFDLWRRKYGEDPRKFRMSHKGYAGTPVHNKKGTK